MSPPIQTHKLHIAHGWSSEDQDFAEFVSDCYLQNIHCTGMNGRTFQDDVLPIAERWTSKISLDNEYFTQHYLEYGAWDEDEIRAWSHVEKLGLIMQEVHITDLVEGDGPFYFSH